MLWSTSKVFALDAFELEADLEGAVIEISAALFGESRIYLDVKKKIGVYGKKQNIPDGYLIDLSSKREPRLYVVENELGVHDPLKHVAVQILEFSLSFEMAPQRVKAIIKAALLEDAAGLALCNAYAQENGFENVDFLLERMIYDRQAFNALVIIDEMAEELETVLRSRFNFPVEILTLQRYSAADGERMYVFEPFLQDLQETQVRSAAGVTQKAAKIDPAEIDTIVVPAREEGFQETFIGEDSWYSIRLHSSMLKKIKYVAAYRVAPISAITHIAAVHAIEPWKDTNKYILYFDGPARKIGPIQLVSNGAVKAPQAPRYTSMAQLEKATNLDEAFG